jgi:hypothetical protein
MIRGFEAWSANLVQTSSLADLKDATVAIEAADYLKRFLLRHKEKLLPALGGYPFVLNAGISEEIAAFRKHGITPIFVFSGLDIGSNRDRSFRLAEEASRTNSEAWQLYDQHQAERAVEAFGCSRKI